VRIDFLHLQMKPMTQGVCDTSNLLALRTGPGQVAQVAVPELCGSVARAGDPLASDLPHVYIHLDRAASRRAQVPQAPPAYVELEARAANHSASWDLRLSQVSCDGAALQAPPGCGQWYNAPAGNISSLNLADGSYQTGQALTACIARDTAACAIEYRLDQMQVWQS
jgi:hypothetical protein